MKLIIRSKSQSRHKDNLLHVAHEVVEALPDSGQDRQAKPLNDHRLSQPFGGTGLQDRIDFDHTSFESGHQVLGTLQISVTEFIRALPHIGGASNPAHNPLAKIPTHVQHQIVHAVVLGKRAPLSILIRQLTPPVFHLGQRRVQSA
ncbi:MAG: hypothetical protein ABGZ17_11040, partial [Planctomycetaceae bacterium]